ncbi:CACTA en-spm transposon protein [Cucumis melo var. makuwa]|uniref:CACTA en-spm transposon protein n=1 Tax=Cucumis melo var. makuwa TaxID=1194695 RepID=A0A5D3DHG6_CUCMM|nr:CACTA en-spm transposon protein [Cucumis melo var. makuwa]TYK23066.1 CACTA en-spm transposon protein [Cucumis melo var. makuwa]
MLHFILKQSILKIGPTFTTRKWSIPDAKKDVDIKNVENKGFPDAINTASGDASGKHSFPTHHEGVGKYLSGKGPKRRENRLMAPFPDAFLGDFPTPQHCIGIPFLIVSVLYFTEPKPRGKKRGEAEKGKERFVVVSVILSSLFHRRPSPPSATLGSSSQQTTPTPRRHAQSRLLELERHVAINGRIPMMIAPEAEKPISLHVVRFSQAIGVCERHFPSAVLSEQTLGENTLRSSRATARFVEHQMLTTFKEFRADCHRHFKNYIDLEKARANPPNALVRSDEDWHFLCDHYISRAFQQSRTNKAAKQKQPYNHSRGSKSFLQRQYELAERKGESVDRVELFWETHVRAETFVS